MTRPSSPLRVMGIGAHPDDLELLCGGTLAAYRADGAAVTMCHLARGDRGAVAGDRDELAAIRGREGLAAASLIGADYINLGIPDGEVSAADERQKQLLTEAIRSAAPDVIIAHSPGDYMADHVEAAALAFSCSFLATLPLYTTSSPAIEVVPALLHMDTLAGLGFEPVEFVDIGDHFETKLDLMRRHASQLDWLSSHDEMDVLRQIETVAAFRGFQAGVRYAEAFVPSTVHLRVRPYRLLP